MFATLTLAIGLTMPAYTSGQELSESTASTSTQHTVLVVNSQDAEKVEMRRGRAPFVPPSRSPYSPPSR